MDTHADSSGNIVTAASLASPDEITPPTGAHGSEDRIATEGWVLAQLDAFKTSLFQELNVQFGTYLSQMNMQHRAMVVPGVGDTVELEKEEIIPILRDLVKTHKFPASETVRNAIIAKARKQAIGQPVDEEKITTWINNNQRWLSTKMRELRSTENKHLRKTFCRVFPEKPKEYMNWPQRWEQYKKECGISTAAEEAWAHIVIETLLNDSTLGKLGETEVYKRFKAKIGDDAVALPLQREKLKTKRARTSSSSRAPKRSRSSGMMGKEDDDGALEDIHDSNSVAPHHELATPPKDHM